ncbi:hypothetical protein RchiOBHm_Chr6g0285611 [Rosa chinensis]|uniref:Uncharacterized protein n=1 Tax=Rosa chinensis TaxID=74649 RepID=A0A2P6PUK5_ROSCH|nr:uncharacterized protein LOC112169346 isoform X2 [Rosa chinensis]PRQ25619.1 hypothetical protein RchiOBHm_Chr6g0285611 [Rosa chinensis]
MKRKFSERIPKAPWQIQSPSPRGHRLRRSSDSRFPITTPPTTTDISGKKGVKFTNLDDENRRPPRTESDNAKTSEYAFFKKLKEDASHKHHSCSESKEAYRGSNSKPRGSSRDRTNMVRNKSDDVRSSVFNKDVTEDSFESSHALPGSASRNSGSNRTRAQATLEDLHRKKKYMVEETENTLNPKGKGLDLFEETETQCRHANVFDRKRQKLLHWVRETSIPEIDYGSSLVSVLLSRLIPTSNGNNNVKNPKLMKVVPVDESMPLPSFESDIHFKELQLAPTKRFMDLGCDPYFGDATLSCRTKRSRNMVSCSYSPTSDAYKNHLDYTVWEPNSELLGGSAILCPNSDSYSILPFKEYGLVTSGYVKESDIFYQPPEYMVGREPCTPMLGWDFDRIDEERKLFNLSRDRADSELLGSSTMSCPMIDSDYVLPFREYGLREPSHVKELDVFCQPNEFMVREELGAPMLGWDFDSTDEERKLSNLSRYRVESKLLGSSPMSCPMIDSDYVLPFREYGLRETSHVKELDVFCQPNEYMVRKDLCVPMLGRDFDSTDEERNLSSLSRYRADSELLGGTAISCSMSDVDSVLPFKEYGLRASSHAEELDVFYKPNKYFVGRETCALMLGWDFDTAKERNSSNLSRRTAGHTSACIAGYHSHDDERLCLEGKYELQSDFHQIELPLNLSCIPTLLNRAWGCIDDGVWEGGTTFFSLQNDHWFRRKIINERLPYPNAESLLQLGGSSGDNYSSTCQALQFPREEISSQLLTCDDMNIRCLNDSPHKRTPTHFIKDNVNVHDSSALCLQISLDRQKAQPLGIDIDKPSWDGSEKEISFNDGDVNYIKL